MRSASPREGPGLGRQPRATEAPRPLRRGASAIPGIEALIVGKTTGAEPLAPLIERLRVADRVRILDDMPQERLRLVYSAADALVLSSTREGWPNVLLEAMACGTPVVAAAVGGVREIVTEPIAGTVVEAPDAASLARAASDLLVPRRNGRRYAATRNASAGTRSSAASSPSFGACSPRSRRDDASIGLSLARAGRREVAVDHPDLPSGSSPPGRAFPGEPDARELESRMRWVKCWFNVLPLGEAVVRLGEGRLPERPLSITFDDGYADNATVAAPILLDSESRRRSSSRPASSTGGGCGTTR